MKQHTTQKYLNVATRTALFFYRALGRVAQRTADVACKVHRQYVFHRAVDATKAATGNKLVELLHVHEVPGPGFCPPGCPPEIREMFDGLPEYMHMYNMKVAYLHAMVSPGRMRRQQGRVDPQQYDRFGESQPAGQPGPSPATADRFPFYN